MKRILIHSLVFSPDGVSTAYLYNDIALKLKERGYEVVVLTTTPHFNVIQDQISKQSLHWKLWGLCKTSEFNGIKVYHVPQKKYINSLLRMIGFTYWHIVSFMLGLCIRKVDLILSPSPPLTIGLINLLLAKIKGCKVIYNVQEIYPDILKIKPGIVQKILKWIEFKVYNGSDAVIAIDQVFYDTIVKRINNKNKLSVIPNFVDTHLYRECKWEGMLDPFIFPQNEKLKMVYAGNIGFAQDWDSLLALAEMTQDMTIDYIVIGEGVRKKYLEEESVRRGLKNLRLLPYQNRDFMPYILSYSNLNFIFMTPQTENDGFPSKVYTIMACKRPLLIFSGEGTPIIKFLNGKGCAKLITEKDYIKKIKDASSWLHSITKEELLHMGEQGFKIINESYTKEIITDKYLELVNEVINYTV